MSNTLVLCPGCTRHVLVSEANCPFCSIALPTDLASSAVPAAGRRLGRAAAFVFGASLAVAGCSDTIESGGSGGGSSGGETGQDGGTDSGPDDDGGGMALYGVPPPDDGGPGPMYGAPPPMDAGIDAPIDDGGSVPLYGAPPPPPDSGLPDAG